MSFTELAEFRKPRNDSLGPSGDGFMRKSWGVAAPGRQGNLQAPARGRVVAGVPLCTTPAHPAYDGRSSPIGYRCSSATERDATEVHRRSVNQAGLGD